MTARVTNPAEGIYTMVVARWQDPETSAELIDEVADDPAAAGVYIMTAGASPPPGDLRYDPIFEAAERHDQSLVFHGTPGLNYVEGADAQTPATDRVKLARLHSRHPGRKALDLSGGPLTVGEHRVANIDETPSDRRLIVEIDGRKTGLLRVGDKVPCDPEHVPAPGRPGALGGLFPSTRGCREQRRRRVCGSRCRRRVLSLA
jgi:Amidohydrolase